MFNGLARVLTEARTELGVTQGEIADRAQVSGAMLSAYERGKQAPKLETLGRILDALGLDAEEFGRRLRGERGPRRARIAESSGYLPERTAIAVAELLEDLGGMTRMAIRRPAPAKTKRGGRGRRRKTDAGDR
jgi:transcriptional regulator with XRE-family HTH domain